MEGSVSEETLVFPLQTPVRDQLCRLDASGQEASPENAPPQFT